MGNTQKVGSLGEELVVTFLMKRGYTILDRNFWKPWGELDIVAKRKNKIHFVEVKTQSGFVKEKVTPVVKPRILGLLRGAAHKVVSSETLPKNEREKILEYIKFAPPKDWFRPEERVNKEKIKRQGRIIQTYLNAKHVSDETKWQFDVATVVIDEETKKAKINLLEDLAL